jgi:hypothetical protein
MKSLTGVCGVITAMALVCLAAGKGSDEPKKELAKLQGTWIVVAAEENAKEIPNEVLNQVKRQLTFKDDRFTMTVQGIQGTSMKVRCDPGQTHQNQPG